MLQTIAYFPHPPIVLPEVGGADSEKVSATYQAMKKLATAVASAKPDYIVAITPHGHIFSDAISITALGQLEGDLGRFGAPEVKVSFPLAGEAVQSIITGCQSKNFFCAALDSDMLREYKLPLELDHGLVIPLYLIVQAGWQGSLVPINMAFLPFEELYDFGASLAKVLENIGKNWALVISGDLSHRLLPEAPAGYSPQGAVFDEILRQAVREGDVKRIIHMDHVLIEDAGECGLRPLIMGLGVLDGYEIKGEELSYEGPFGVGYLVARMEKGARDSKRELVKDLYREREQRLQDNRRTEAPLVNLARRSIELYLNEARYLDNYHGTLGEQEELLNSKAGAFVSLKKHEQLRGCIGTIEPTKENLAEEIIHNAVSAALNDPRFEPLEIEELAQLSISVDVLGKPEKVASLTQLDPKTFGVIVSRGTRRGLLLPDLPGITSAEEQVNIAKQKAGISKEEEVVLERFRVTRYT